MTKGVIKGMQEAFVEKFEAKRAKYVKVRECVNELFGLMSENPHLVMNREFYAWSPMHKMERGICVTMKDRDDVVGVYIHDDIYHAVIGYLKSMFSFKYTEDVPMELWGRPTIADKLIVPQKFIEAAFGGISSVDGGSIESRLRDYLFSVYNDTFLSDGQIDALKAYLTKDIMHVYLGRFQKGFEYITGNIGSNNRKNKATVAFMQNYMGIKVSTCHDYKLTQEDLSPEMAKVLSDVVFSKQ